MIHYKTKLVQGRYLERNDVLIFEKHGFLRTKETHYKIVSDDFTRESGWNITFDVVEVGKEHEGVKKMTIDMMENHRAYKVMSVIR